MGTAPGIPKLHRAIFTAGDDALSIRRKGHRKYGIGLFSRLYQFLSTNCVPHSRCVVPTAAYDTLSVRRERHRPDTVSVIGKFQQRDAGHGIPYPDRVI